MQSYTYLIIGGGMAADAAVSGIREIDVSGRIGIIGEEKYTSYNRPFLSKGLWTGKQEAEIWNKTEKQYVFFHLETKAVAIDPESHQVIDDKGDVYSYEKLLFATGGRPSQLDCPNEGVIYFRTLDDYYHLRTLYDKGEDFTVIGGGYIGTEIAASLTMNGKHVRMIFPERTIGAMKLPQGFSNFLNTYFLEKGIEIICEQGVQSIKKENDRYIIKTSDENVFYSSGVIAGIGITPRVELAHLANLKVENGIIVNSRLQTSDPDIFAAGDVANFYNPLLEKRMRCEHEDTALTMGSMAGRNMAGSQETYTHLPYFYSDLFDLGYEAIGELSSDMEMIEDWQELYRKGVIYYLRNGCVRGAFLLGIWHQTASIREMIASKKSFTKDALAGKIMA